VTTVSAITEPPATVAADALVLASAPAHAGPGTGATGNTGGAVLVEGHGLPPEAADQIADALRAVRASGDPDEVVKLPGVAGVRAALVAVSGLGPLDRGATAYPAETLRRAVGAAVRELAGSGAVAIAFPAPGDGTVAAVAEGAMLGAYRFAGLHRAAADSDAAGAGPSRSAPVDAVQVIGASADDSAVAEVLRRASVLGIAHEWARDLVNTPPNVLYPESFAQAVRERAAGTPVQVTVLDERALEEGGFGGTIGVGRGSHRPPRLVTMTYSPAGAQARVALVGKGITFDSGGLDLKPPASMLTMKCDMAGAAAVAATVLAAAELRLPVAVTGYLCLAENMPGGNAQRPSDVVTMRDGTTVEIVDTDAEGRMVLADGIALACEQAPGAIVDIATLTGHQVVALGQRIGALMAGQDDFRERLHSAADASGEAFWPMPLPRELRSQLDSQVADLLHKGDRMAGMLTAGLFLQQFVSDLPGDGGQIPWAHLDIAGPAWNDSAAHGYTPKGGTGFGIRTMLTLVESYAGS
jgi:leucyl aminopeptidase